MEKSGIKSGMKNYCKKCDYYGRDKYDLTRHLTTTKHKMDNMDNDLKTERGKDTHPYHCTLCAKKYKFKRGLCKHKKNAHPFITSSMENYKVYGHNPPVVADKEKESLKKEVKEFRYMIQEIMKVQTETNKQFQKTLNRVIDEAGTTNNFNNNMSINIYLNEKCKNAMNLTDFVDQLKISLEDLMYTKNHGYVKGISNIFVKQLQDMEPTERPIHCSDRKRLQFYVKDEDKWGKNNNCKIDKSIEDITILQIKQIKKWEIDNPNYLKDETLLTQWHTMIQNAMGGQDDDARIKNKDSIKKELSILEVKKELEVEDNKDKVGED